MIDRKLKDKILEMAGYFPVVSVTGPRQSGKSTLVKDVFSNYDYLNLEDSNIYSKASKDPIGFIFCLKNKTIIDEAQLVPELFSAIQLYVDKNDIPGSVILTGSQNFLLSKKISQSLAGRVAIVKLMPMSYLEISKSKYKTSYDDIILKGGYPRLYKNNIPPKIFYNSYIETYIKRDVEGYLSVNNSIDFEKFIKLLANNCGQLVNYSRFSNDLNVDVKTVKNWISILASSYIIYLLPSYSTNTRKQVIKTPKIYFYDTGLLCNLLNIDTVSSLIDHEMFGFVFENFIIVERIKHYLNQIENYSLFYYRDKSRQEIDLVDCSTDKIFAIEIKSGMTFKPIFNKVVSKSEDLLKLKNISKSIIYRGDYTFDYDDTKVYDIKDWLNCDCK